MSPKNERKEVKANRLALLVVLLVLARFPLRDFCREATRVGLGADERDVNRDIATTSSSTKEHHINPLTISSLLLTQPAARRPVEQTPTTIGRSS